MRPFFDLASYCNITLTSPRHVETFLQFLTQTSNRQKGRHVKNLTLRSHKEDLPRDKLEALFHLLPDVVNLELRAGLRQVAGQSRRVFGLLTKVESVWIKLEQKDFSLLSFLSSLPSLSTLEISQWSSRPTTSTTREEEDRSQLLRLETLTLSGGGVAESSVANFLDRCPALKHVELSARQDNGPVPFGEILPHLPSDLHILKLQLQECDFVRPLDRLLRRFTSLRCLELDDSLYSGTIHSTLLRLLHLVRIRLGGGAIISADFLDLFSGSERLVHLECLELEAGVGVEGCTANESIQVEDLYEILGREMEDWNLPRFSTRFEAQPGSQIRDPLDFVGLKRLIAVAEKKGIEVGGSIHEALENLEKYWIEAVNRATLAVYLYDRDLDNLDLTARLDDLKERQWQAEEVGIDLPSTDTDSLDRDRLELVKTRYNGADSRYSFSLKNSEEEEESSSQEEDSEDSEDLDGED